MRLRRRRTCPRPSRRLAFVRSMSCVDSDGHTRSAHVAIRAKIDHRGGGEDAVSSTDQSVRTRIDFDKPGASNPPRGLERMFHRRIDMVNRLIQVLVFVVVSAVSTILLMFFALVLNPGRGFLPSSRGYYDIDLELSRDGGWHVTRSAEVKEHDWTHPRAGVRVYLQESSMGRWDAGEFSAWRARHWMIEDAIDASGAPIDVGNGATDASQLPEGLRDALVLHVERVIIPHSALWEMWPHGDQRSAPRTTTKNLRWFGWSRAFESTMLVVFAVLGLVPGTIAARRIGRRKPRSGGGPVSLVHESSAWRADAAGS